MANIVRIEYNIIILIINFDSYQIKKVTTIFLDENAKSVKNIGENFFDKFKNVFSLTKLNSK